jgi:hypothetical protein
MKKIVGIHQPQYLPWLGLLDRVSKCDIFVVLDTVAYSKNYFYNRNRIKTANGVVWLTIPVLSRGNAGESFLYTKIDEKQKWADKHLKTLRQAYNKTPFYQDYGACFEEFYSQPWELLVDVCISTFSFLLRSFDIPTKVVRASELHAEGCKEELLLSICRATCATHYLSGPDGRNYLTPDIWADNGIAVDFQNYQHPKYPQPFGEFTSNMSSIDLLFNCGSKGIHILTKEQPSYFQDNF